MNVDFDVYRIKTEITREGRHGRGRLSTWASRARRPARCAGRRLDEDIDYDASQLDRAVVAKDQIRTVIQDLQGPALHRDLPRPDRGPEDPDLRQGRLATPRTSSSIVREEFGKGNDFAAKITYRTTGKKPEDLLAEFRNSYNPRIAVTVDMIATGTDVKPLGVRVLHARREVPDLLRADEGSRRAGHQPDRPSSR